MANEDSDACLRFATPIECGSEAPQRTAAVCDRLMDYLHSLPDPCARNEAVLRQAIEHLCSGSGLPGKPKVGLAVVTAMLERERKRRVAAQHAAEQADAQIEELREESERLSNEITRIARLREEDQNVIATLMRVNREKTEELEGTLERELASSAAAHDRGTHAARLTQLAALLRAERQELLRQLEAAQRERDAAHARLSQTSADAERNEAKLKVADQSLRSKVHLLSVSEAQRVSLEERIAHLLDHETRSKALTEQIRAQERVSARVEQKMKDKAEEDAEKHRREAAAQERERVRLVQRIQALAADKTDLVAKMVALEKEHRKEVVDEVAAREAAVAARNEAMRQLAAVKQDLMEQSAKEDQRVSEARRAAAAEAEAKVSRLQARLEEACRQRNACLEAAKAAEKLLTRLGA